MLALNSAISGITWPALVQGRPASLLALLMQLELSQWWPWEELERHQFQQLVSVLEHAERTVDFYRERIRGAGLAERAPLTAESWRRLPLLSRGDIQVAGELLHSNAVPRSHGKVSTLVTSGSTGQPVATLGTEVTKFLWNAITLRDHLWHRRDFRQSFAAIRYTGSDDSLPPQGSRHENWGTATHGITVTGPAHLLNVRSSLEEQTDWLLRVDPGYLLAYPSVLKGIARRLAHLGRTLPGLRQVRSFGEILESECRAECERAFGVPVVDMYSAQEVGYLALQCPASHDYHVQSEGLLVEVLDAHGRPCREGQIGRIVVTTLHNFAMPLLRYDIGDLAEVGPVCGCGRGLPTLRRIFGRQRNLLIMPDGQWRWPVFDAAARPDDLPPLRQFQVVQQSLTRIEVNIVGETDYTPQQQAVFARYLQQMLGHAFDVTIRRVPSIARSSTGKFEDFISLVAPTHFTS